MRLHRRDRRAGVDFCGSRRRSFSAKRCSRSAASTSTRPGSRGRAAAPAFGARINMPNDPINWRMSVREVQDGYDPVRSGFVDRRAYPDDRSRHALHRRTERGRYASYHPAVSRFEGDFNNIFNLDGRLESRRTDVQLMRVDLHSSDVLEFHLVSLYRRLPRDFQISPGVIPPAGQAAHCRRFAAAATFRHATTT